MGALPSPSQCGRNRLTRSRSKTELVEPKGADYVNYLTGIQASAMTKQLHRYLLASAFILLAACGTDEGFVPEELSIRPQVAELQFVNLIPDSPELLVTFVDDDANTAFSDVVEFGTSTVQRELLIDDYDLNVSYFDADGDQITIIENESIRLTDPDQLVYIFTGTLAAPNLEFRTFLEPQYDESPIESGTVEVWFTSGVVDPTSLDVYLTSPTEDLSSATPITNLIAGGVSEVLTIDRLTSYRLRVTSNNATEVLFDSGVFILSDRSRTLFALAEYFGPDLPGTTVPNVNGIGVNAFGSTSFSNSGLPSQLRAINLTSDLPAVDLYFGSTTNAPYTADLNRLEVGSYTDIDTGINNLNVTLPGVKDQFLFEQDLTVASGTFNTLVVFGSDTDDSLSSVLFINDARPIDQRVTINFVNTALVNNSTNVYFLDPGQVVADSTPQIAGAATNSFSTFTARPATVDLVITSALNSSVLYGPERTTLTGGINYSFILVEDTISAGSTTELVVLEDAN